MLARHESRKLGSAASRCSIGLAARVRNRFHRSVFAIGVCAARPKSSRWTMFEPFVWASSVVLARSGSPNCTICEP